MIPLFKSKEHYEVFKDFMDIDSGGAVDRWRCIADPDWVEWGGKLEPQAGEKFARDCF